MPPTPHTKNKLGQYFTTHPDLKAKVADFILNGADRPILEPSVGRGDLVEYVLHRSPTILFDMYEIDPSIEILDAILPQLGRIVYGDFLQQSIENRYRTIIGNPPYVKSRSKRGNLYIDFVEKCFRLLDDGGELIFIVPSDFLKLTSSAKLLDEMMAVGTFTHIYHPHNENLFQNASIDVIVFRYCRNAELSKTVLHNDQEMEVVNSNGLITFREIVQIAQNRFIQPPLFQDHFDIYVGMVSGREEIYKHPTLGNIEVLNDENQLDRYIYLTQFPSGNAAIDSHLLAHKENLIGRKIRKFSETNWFEWGAARNISAIGRNLGEDCIYVNTLTRSARVAFRGKVQYFGGGLLMMVPKKKNGVAHEEAFNIDKIVDYLNSHLFRSNFTFSGRFKIGQRQLCQSQMII
jgi:adenine-specific DNA-methyltransferase